MSVRINQEPLLIHIPALGTANVRLNQEVLILHIPIVTCAPTQITGGPFVDGEGNPVANGTITFQLSADAKTCSNTQISANRIVTGNLDSNGNISGTLNIWSTDPTKLTNTNQPLYYKVAVFKADGQLCWRNTIHIPPTSPFNIGTATI